MESSLSGSSPQVLVCDADKITVKLLADDLRRQEHFQISECIARAAQIRLSISQQRPNVLLLGLSARDPLPESLTVLRQVRQEFPWIRTIVLSEETGRELALEVFRAGAKGVFDRAGYDAAQLCRCIQCVADGQIWARSELLSFVLESFACALPAQNTRDVEYLTPRERDVARLVGNGLCNSDIAKELGISVHTVKNYLFSVFDKTGVSSRAELILYLLANNAPSKINAITGCVGGYVRNGSKHVTRARRVSRNIAVSPARVV
jgi:DNA-binding NarL/FixJ family response regulator